MKQIDKTFYSLCEEIDDLKEAVESQVSFRTKFNHRTPREMVDLVFRNKDSELFMRTLLTG